MIHTFKRGVHPNYMKAPEIPISVVTPPPQVIIPMAQRTIIRTRLVRTSLR